MYSSKQLPAIGFLTMMGTPTKLGGMERAKKGSHKVSLKVKLMQGLGWFVPRKTSPTNPSDHFQDRREE